MANKHMKRCLISSVRKENKLKPQQAIATHLTEWHQHCGKAGEAAGCGAGIPHHSTLRHLSQKLKTDVHTKAHIWLIRASLLMAVQVGNNPTVC